MKNNISLLLATLLFTSCEKVIDVKYDGNQSRIIIEGNITNEPGSYFVKITKSISLKEIGEFPAIDNAVVTISDNVGNSEILTPKGHGLYSTEKLIGTIGRPIRLLLR